MGISIQGKPGGEVAQHAGDGLDIHAILQGDGRERMPLRYNYDKPGKP